MLQPIIHTQSSTLVAAVTIFFTFAGIVLGCVAFLNFLDAVREKERRIPRLLATFYAIGFALGGGIAGAFTFIVLATVATTLAGGSHFQNLYTCVTSAFTRCESQTIDKDAVVANIETTYTIDDVIAADPHYMPPEITERLTPSSPAFTGIHDGIVVDFIASVDPDTNIPTIAIISPAESITADDLLRDDQS